VGLDVSRADAACDQSGLDLPEDRPRRERLDFFFGAAGGAAVRAATARGAGRAAGAARPEAAGRGEGAGRPEGAGRAEATGRAGAVRGLGGWAAGCRARGGAPDTEGRFGRDGGGLRSRLSAGPRWRGASVDSVLYGESSDNRVNRNCSG